MSMFWKKSLSLLLAITMLCSALPMAALAEEVAPHEHSYAVASVADPSCEAAGSVTYACACGDSYTESIAALGHSVNSSTTPATCTADGAVVYSCDRCGASSTEVVPAAGHAYQAVTVEPTCTEAGSVAYTCAACGDTYYEEIPASGHAWGDWSVSLEPTTEAEGAETRACASCGATESQPIAKLEPTPAPTEEPVVTPEPTAEPVIPDLEEGVQDEVQPGRVYFDSLNVAAGATIVLDSKDDTSVPDDNLRSTAIATPNWWLDGGIRYRVKDSGSGWTETNQATGEITLVHGTTYEVQERYTRYVDTKFSNSYYVTFKVYHEVTASVDASANAEGAGSVTATGKVYHNEPATIAVTPVTDYKAELYLDGKLVTTLEGDNWTYTIPAVTASTDGYTVKYISTKATEYNVTLNLVNDEGETVTAKLGNNKGIAGAEIAVIITKPADTDSVKYTYEITTDKEVSGATVNGDTITLGAADAEVTVTFTKHELVKNTTIGTVGFNPKKDVATQLDALKQNIFTAVVNSGASLPEGIAYTDLNYQYIPWYKGDVSNDYKHSYNGVVGTGIGAFNEVPHELTAAPTNRGSHTGYSFGILFAAGDNRAEKVRLTGTGDWAGLFVEAEITLVDNRGTQAVGLSQTYTETAPYEYETNTALDNYVKSILGVTTGDGTITAVERQTALSGTDAQQVTYHVDVAETTEFKALTDAVVTVWVKLKTMPAVINFETAGEGSGSFNLGGLTANGTLAGNEEGEGYVLSVTPADLDGSDGSAMYVEKVTVSRDGVSADIEGTYNNGVFTAVVGVNNNKEYTITITYGKNEIAAQNVTAYINGYKGSLSLDYDTALAGYKENLTVANIKTHGPETGSYKVQMNTAGGWMDVDSLTTWNAAYLDVPATKTVRLVWTPEDANKYVALNKEAKATIVDSRLVLDVTAKQDVVTIEAKSEPTDVEAQVRAAFEVTATNPQTGAVTTITDYTLDFDPNYAWPADSETSSFEVTAYVVWLANGTYSNNPSAKLTLTCVDTTIKYTVAYVDGFGETLYSELHAENTTTPTIDDPTKEHYEFAGWDKVIADTVTENITYTATWTPVDYTITFDSNGGSDVAAITAPYGSAVEAPEETTKEGYKFLGWFYTEGETEKEFVFGTDTMPGNGVTLTAKWQILQYTFTFDVNGGVYADAEFTGTYTKDYAKEVGAPVVTKEGYSFEGWYEVDAEGNVAEVAYSFGTMPAADKKFVAKWSENVALVIAEGKTVGYPSLQEAIDAAQALSGAVEVQLIDSVEENVTVTQKQGLDLTISGANNAVLTGVLTIDGGSHQTSEKLTIKGINFQQAAGKDSCIYVPGAGARYSHNVTVEDCVFDGTDNKAAAIRTATAGCVNWAITNCTVNEGMHSMLQVKGIDGLTIKNAKVYSKNGLNVNNSHNIVITDSIIDVKGYAVRLGESSNSDVAPEVEITKNFLRSNEEDGAIVIRSASRNIDLTMSENVVVVADGLQHITGAAGENASYDLDNNYWNGKDILTDIDAIVTETYYREYNQEGFDENLSDLFDKCVAEINGIHYLTLQDAFDAAVEGDTVKLIAQNADKIEESATLNNAVAINLDLNGYTLTSDTDTISVKAGKLTITDNSETVGTIESTGDYCGAVYARGAEVVIEKGNFVSTYEDSYAVYASTGSTVVVNGGKLTADGYGIVVLNADVKVNGGEINAGFGISANGSNNSDDSTLTISDGEITGAEAGIYWPANGLLTIKDGKIKGDSAVIVKSGSLEISGGELTATGEKQDYVHENSGATATGDALMIVNVAAGDYDAIGNVSITGGTFISENANAVGSYAAEGAEAMDDFISGGKFSNDVQDLCAENYKSFENFEDEGLWSVVKATHRIISVKATKAVDTEEAADVVTVDGTEIAKNAETGLVEYTSEPTEAGMTIMAKPVVTATNDENGFKGSLSYVASIKVDGEEQELVYAEDYSVTVEISAVAEDALSAENVLVEIIFSECAFTYDEDGQMRFYTGIETPEYETLYNAVITDPVFDAEYVKSVQYLARPAATYQMQVPVLFEYTIPLINEKITIGGKSVDIDLKDAWLDVGETFTVLTPEELQKQYDTEIQKIKDKIAAIDLSDITWSNALDKAQQFTAISEELNTLIETIKNEAEYLGFHAFGELAGQGTNTDENGNIVERLWVVYDDGAKHLEDDNVAITLVDDRAATTITGGDLTFEYDEYNNDDLYAALKLNAEGVGEIEGELRILVDMSGKNVGTYTYNVYYDGSYDYKPTNAKFTLTVVKAPVSVDVPNVEVTYGESFSIAPVATNKHDKVVYPEVFRFIVGLDAANLGLNGEYKPEGLKGVVQLMVPDSLKTILTMLGLEEGVEMSLSDLANIFGNAGDLLENWGITGEVGSAISGALDQINGILEGADLQVIIGGEEPKDIGVYLHGAVVVDNNYDTAFDVGYLIIKAAAEQVYLDWDYEDPNGIYTWELLKHVGFGASAYNDEAFTQKNDDATAQVQNLFLGVDAYGNFVAKLSPEDDMIGNGAYTQIAFIADFGNEFYYAVPIVRAFLIVPNIANVELRGDSHEANRDLFKTFTNEPQGFNVLVTDNGGNEIYYSYGKEECKNGIDVAVGNGNVRVAYYGLQTNGTAYGTEGINIEDVKTSIESGDFKKLGEYIEDLAPVTDKPVHAGVYIAVATYLEQVEGNLSAVGVDAGVLVIEPTTSSIEVENKILVKKEMQGPVAIDSLVTAKSAAAGVTEPDYITITGSISQEASLVEAGLEAMVGEVNIDLPDWAYEALNVEEDTKVSAEELKKRVKDLVASIEAAAAEFGIETQLSEGLDALTENLAKLDDTVTVTFHNNYAVEEIGVYLIVGIVADSDHYPSVDAGLLVITPAVAEINFLDDTNDNNQFLRTYNGKKQEIKAEVILENGMVADPAALTIYYTGVESAIDVEAGADGLDVVDTPAYHSTVAPTETGAYVVTAVYYEEGENGSFEAIGMEIGVLVIQPAEAKITVEDKFAVYGKEVVAINDLVKIEAATADVAKTVITGGIKVDEELAVETLTALFNGSEIELLAAVDTVNVDLPGWIDAAIELAGLDGDVTVGTLTGIIEDILAAYQDAKAEAKGLVETYDEITILAGALAEMLQIDFEEAKTFLKDVDDNIEVTLETLIDALGKFDPALPVTTYSNFEVEEVGAYVVVGAVTDSDYLPAVDTGVVIIAPAETVVDLVDANDNNQWLYTYGDEVDIKATVTINGEPITEEQYKNLTITYTGIQSVIDAPIYNSTEAPTETGAYVVTAIYYETVDAVDSTGKAVKNIVAIGADLGVLVIQPAEAEIYVENELGITGIGVKVNELVHVADDVTTTVITGGVSLDGGEPTLESINGTVNVDLPEWLDIVLREQYNFDNNVTMGTVVNALKTLDGEYAEELQKLLDAAYEYNLIDTKVEDVAAILDGIIAVLEKIPAEVLVEFHSDITVDETGAYIVVGLITDSDYLPAHDIGVVVITPKIAEINLKDGNENNLWLREFNDEQQVVEVESIYLYDGKTKELTTDDALTLTYTGVQTDGKTYNSTEAPKYAGVYMVTAVYLEKDAETGEIMAIGATLGNLVIAPAELNVEVAEETNTYIYDGKQKTPEGTVATAGSGEHKTVIEAVKFTDPETEEVIVNVNIDAEVIELIKSIIDAMDETYDAAKELPEEAKTLIKAAAALAGFEANDIDQLKKLVVDAANDNVNLGEYVAALKKASTLLSVYRDNAKELISAYGSDAVALVENLLGSEAAALISAYGNEAADFLADYSAKAVAVIDKLAAYIDSQDVDKLTINANNPAEVGKYPVVAIGYLNSDHFIDAADGYLIIKPIEIEVTMDNASKVYGEDDPAAFTYTITSGALAEGDTIADLGIVAGREEGEDAGEYTINATANSRNYNVTIVDGTFKITKKDITVTMDNASKVYGADDPAEFTFTFDDELLVGDDTVADLAITADRVDGEDVGTYAITAAVDSKNYNVTIEPGIFEITKKSITDEDIAIEIGGDLTYNGTEQTQSVIVKDGDKVLTEGVDYTVTGITKATNADTYLLTVEAVETSNYTGKFENVEWVIKPAQIVVIAEDKTMSAADLEVPGLTFVLDTENTVGAVADINSIGIKLTTDNPATTDVIEPAKGEDGLYITGDYPITGTAPEAANWVVTVTPGTLTVEEPDYVCYNVRTGVKYEIVEYAVRMAGSGDTIRMLKDSDQTALTHKYTDAAEVLLTKKVTLDLDVYSLKLDALAGIKGTGLIGEPGVGKLYVGEDGLVLPKEAASEDGYQVLPIYDPAVGAYKLSRFLMSTSGSGKGLTVNGSCLDFGWIFNSSGFARTLLLDGASDNDITFKVRMEWAQYYENDAGETVKGGTAQLDFVYTDNLVETVMKNTKRVFTFKATDIDAMSVDRSTLKVYGVIETVSGAEIVSTGLSPK